MKPEVKELLERLASSEGEVQEDAVLFLAMILERQIPKRRSDPIHKTVLPEDLLELELATDEYTELIGALCDVALSFQLPPNRRSALAGALAQYGNVMGMDAALFVFKQLESSLDDTSAASMMGCITPALCAPEHRDALLGLVLKHETESVLNRIAARASANLLEPVHYLRKSLARLRQS
jgi:hypothetical protein